MCGISGILGPIARELAIGRMVAVQRHRGPDDEGYWVDEDAHIALGHNRLSIIDVSSAGHQPMWSPCGRYALTFNGEIYNYRELRDALQPYPFRSSSDFEVLLAAYAKWGPNCLDHFIGMFGFAIWDERNHTFLCRDRFGIKPFYYATHENSFLFASEIKALLAAGVAPEAELGYLGRLSEIRFVRPFQRNLFQRCSSAGPRALHPVVGRTTAKTATLLATQP